MNNGISNTHSTKTVATISNGSDQASNRLGSAQPTTMREQLSNTSNYVSAFPTTLHDFDNLPNELKLKIVEKLPFIDVASFSRIDKKHNALVRESYNPAPEINFVEELKKAIQDGNNHVIELLAEAGWADLARAIDYFGTTPLHLAVKSGKADVAEKLIQLGAKVDALDGFERSALVYAIGNRCDQQLIKSLLGKGADVNRIFHSDFSSGDNTLLMLAADSSYVDVLPLLKAAGIKNVGAVDSNGRTVLHHAVLRAVPSVGYPEPSPEMLKKLFELFPQDLKEIITLSDKNGRTVLHYAAIHADCQTLQTLLMLFPVELKKIINQTDKGGKTAVQLAHIGDGWNGYYRKEPDPENASLLSRFLK